MKWQNVGSAPCYRPYRLAYRLTDGHGFAKVMVGKVTINRWLPGSVEVFTEAFLREPGGSPPGGVVPVTQSGLRSRRAGGAGPTIVLRDNGYFAARTSNRYWPDPTATTTWPASWRSSLTPSAWARALPDSVTSSARVAGT